MALRSGVAVLVGTALAAGSMALAYAVWTTSWPSAVKVTAYVVLALVGLVGALLTLRDLDRR